MRIALVHDSLMCRGGAEQVTLSFHRAFPEAPIYTLCYQSDLTFPEFKQCTIHTSWLQHFAKTDAVMKRLYFPFGIVAMHQLDVTQYDVVLISSTHCGKYIKVSKNALVINYSHAAFRLVWEPESYAQYVNSQAIKRKVFDLVLAQLRSVDFKAAQRTDYFICNTERMANQVRGFYKIKKPIEVIYPPVNTTNFYVSNNPKKYFLVVSRLEYYKRVDLVIEAFNRLGYSLVVVGKGVQAEEIKAKANNNIVFKSGVSKEELAEIYAGCRAFIFPQYEDYGITPLEANAAGRPVIAYGKGGVLTTQIPASDNPAEATALFFEEQTVDDLIAAVRQFEKIEDQFDSGFIRSHAETFDEEVFINKIRQFVNEKYQQSRKQQVAAIK
ncbi:glycosyltransferase [Spirosoma panaciterrae]|uniref:glycosyltransferase n=1 Tax=Spirosoma panaciterrae TaxID=496058 RepID=UPI000476E062|nr:glycosyltransferase [Spirosoma panaciterrae]